MNLLTARVSSLRIHEGVCLAEFDFRGTTLRMVGLEPPAGVGPGSEVVLGIKATHIILSLRPPEESTLCNWLPVRCMKVEAGEILASVNLEFEGFSLEAIVPRSALVGLVRREGEALFASFQASELSIVSLHDGKER